MAFQSKDSVLDLASLLEEHHDRHNSALDQLEPNNVGDLAQVPVGMDRDDSESDEKNDAAPASRETSPPRRAILNAMPEEDPTSPSSVATSLFNSPPKKMLSTKVIEDGENTTYFEFDPSLLTPTIYRKSKKAETNLLTCLFPWLMNNTKSYDHKDKVKEEIIKLLPRKDSNKNKESEGTKRVSSENGEDDPSSAKSNEEVARTGQNPAAAHKAISTNAPEEEETAPPQPEQQKGILKNWTPLTRTASLRKNENINGQRRNLFAKVYAPSTKKGGTDKRKLEFSPMARVLSVDSHRDMTMKEKAGIWWTKKDYSDFKQTSRLVTRAVLTKGSEVWIMTNSSWDTKSNKPTADSTATPRDEKWWCKFGHSRRGLEHVTSPQEGQERSKNVKRSIRSVIEEQRRQKRTLEDPQKLRQVYIRANQWSRKLCIAAGAADAEAVQYSFDEQKVRCRNTHLQRQSSGVNLDLDNEDDEDSTDDDVPSFMKKHMGEQQASPPRKVIPEMTVEVIHDAPSNAQQYHKQARGYGMDE